MQKSKSASVHSLLQVNSANIINMLIIFFRNFSKIPETSKKKNY